jgi:hypothetical protein
MSHDRRGLCATLLLTVVLLAATTRSQVTLAGNETSRLAAVQSLVENGTFAIDASQFRTVDAVVIDGRLYSDKPPLLTCWLAVVYAAMYHGWGISLREPAAYHQCVYLLSAAGGGLFALSLAAAFFRRLRHESVGPTARSAFSILVVFGTWIFSYGTTINSHTPAALTLFVGWTTLERFQVRPRASLALLSGLLMGTVCNLDLPAGGVFSIAGAVAVTTCGGASWRTGAAPFCIGVVLMLALFAVLDVVQHGSLVPAYLMVGGYRSAGGFHPEMIAGQGHPRDPLEYLFTITLGARGLLSHMPFLAFGLAPLLVKRLRPPLFPILAAAVATHALFCAVATRDYGGWAYGFRYLVAPIPLVFLLAVRVFSRLPRELSAARRRVAHGLAGIALAAGVLTSAVGAWNPWPVCFEGAATMDRIDSGSHPARLDGRVRWPLAANLLCIAFRHDPDGRMVPRLAKWTLGTCDYDRPLTFRYLERAFTNRQDRPGLAAVWQGRQLAGVHGR